MHSQGVLHRDLSAANIFLDFEACIVMGDLGLAKRVAASDANDELATTICGTPDFFSPELICGKPYGRGSDAWAVGVILFNLLTLERPFQASVMLKLAQQIVDGKPSEAAQRKLELARRNYPPELCALASRDGLLNPDASRRTTLERVLELYPLEPC